MSNSQISPTEDHKENATLRAYVIELKRENDLLKQAQHAQAKPGDGPQTSGAKGAPEFESLQHIYTTAPIGLCCFDKKLRYVFVNEWLAAINGLSVKEHLGRPISEVLPDVAARVEAQLRRVIETGKPVVGGTVEAETAAEPGIKKYFEHNYDAVRSAGGIIVGVSCVVQEVTERKQAEEALHESEERMRSLVEGAFEGIIISDKGTILEANHAFADMFGYKLEEVIGLSPFELTTPESAVKIAERIATGDERPYEFVGLKKEGALFDIEVIGKNCKYRGRDVRITAMRDITERKQADEALKEREQHFRLFSLSTGDCFWNWDMVAGTVERSSGFERAFGYREQEIRSDIEWWGDRIHPEDKERVWKVFDAAVAGDQSICDYEYRFRCQDGSYAVVDDHVCLIRDATGKVVRSLGAMRDITERERAEAELRESEALFHGLAETIKEVLFVVDHDPYDLLYVNRAYEEIWGRTCKSLYEQPHSWEDTVVSDDRERVNAGIERQQHTGEFDEEFRIRRPDGSVRWIHDRVVPILCEGKPLRFVGLAEDITERKRAEEALSASETRFRTMFESSVIAIAINDEDGGFIETNPAFQKMFGYRSKGLEEMTFSQLTHPADVDHGWELFRELIDGKRDSFHLEKRYYRKDQTLLWGSVSVSAIRNADGRLRHTIAMVEDITARKQAEEALRRSEERLALALEATSEGLWDWNIATGEMFYSPRWCEMLGFDTSEVEPHGRFWEGLVHAEDLPRFTEALNVHFEQKTELFECEVRLRTKSGEYRWILDRGKVVERDEDGKPLRMIGVDVDITERKRAEQASHDKQVQLDNLLSNVDAIILEGDPLDIYYVGGQVEKILGYPKEMWFEHPEGPVGFWSGLLHPDDADSIEICRQAILRGEDHSFEYRLIAKNGKEIWFLDSVMVECFEGKPVKTRSVMIDITARKQAEEAMRESELKHRSLVESANAVPWKIELETRRFTYIGQQVEQLLGYPMNSWVDFDTWVNRIHPEDRDYASAYCIDATSRGEDHEFEYRAIAADGQHIWIRDVVSVSTGDDGTMELIGFMFNITERKHAEEQARQLQADLAHMSRLSTLGEMASGLAHELGQPLTVIANYANGCIRRLHSENLSQDELKDMLERISAQARRGGSIIRGLESLVRKGEAIRVSIDINESILEIVDLTEVDAKRHKATTHLELKPKLPSVLADPTQVQQVILNLVQNACEACEQVPVSQRLVTIHTARAGEDELEITVSDSGPGIDSELSDHLFEPFFTTKQKGIGMGLAISRSIVEAHHGKLWTSKNPESGASFHFTLPIAKEDKSHEE